MFTVQSDYVHIIIPNLYGNFFFLHKLFKIDSCSNYTVFTVDEADCTSIFYDTKFSFIRSKSLSLTLQAKTIVLVKSVGG